MPAPTVFFSTKLTTHQCVRLGRRILQLQLLQGRDIRTELLEVDGAHGSDIMQFYLVGHSWMVLGKELGEELEFHEDVALQNLEVRLRLLQGVDLLQKEVLDPCYRLCA